MIHGTKDHEGGDKNDNCVIAEGPEPKSVIETLAIIKRPRHQSWSLEERLQPEQQRRYLRLPQVDPTLRIHDMRVAVVSICAYPLEHPLVLRNITPDNRKSYGNLHGYDVHVHYDHPMPGEGVHIQHSKLQLVADYLRSGLYDWVAWFDCDSIITNLNRTLDSVIFRYARRDARFMPLEHGKTSGLNSGDYDTFGGHGDGPEPLEDEVLDSFVGHVGSCNSDEGCFLSTTLRVNPRTRYVATLRAAQIDMAEDSEKLSFVTVGGQDMGALALAGFDQWTCIENHRCVKLVQ